MMKFVGPAPRLKLVTVTFFNTNMKNLIHLSVLMCGLAAGSLSLPAQDAVPPPTPDYQPLSDQQLDQLLGPIALYPDPLTAQILPASTLPTQIVLADRYITSGGDTNQLDQQPWDASVRGLAHYPTVLQWMDDNLNWTTELGQAFLNQQQDVMNSIQRLRSSAKNLGNLQTTPQQQVVDDGSYIEIVPADPQIIYVPVYDPTVVYYQQPFGPPFVTFGFGFGVGWWLNCDFDWGHRNIVVWNHSHPRPPNWWHEPPHQRQASFGNNNHVWHPSTRPSFVGSNRGDRGWNNNPAARRPTPMPAHPNPPGQGGHNNNNGNNFHPGNSPGNNNPPPHNNNNPPPHNSNVGPAIHDNTPSHNSPAPAAPAQRFTPISPAPRPPVSSSANSGAFIGIQSSHDTKDFSNRGQQSIQSTRPAPSVERSAPPSAPAPSRSAPPSNSGGGGGGGGGHGSSKH
jgi:hypothetical protein